MFKHHTPTLAPGPNASNIVTTMKDFQSTSRYPLVIVKGHGYTFEDVVGIFCIQYGACQLGCSHPNIIEVVANHSKI